MSISLNGTNQALRVTSQLTLGAADANPWAISAFFKRSRTSTANQETIAARGNAASGTNFACAEMSTTNALRGRRYAGASDTITGSTITSTADWQHVVVFFPQADGVSRTCKMWLNGVADGTVTSTRTSTSALDTFYIGRTGGSTNLNYFGGKIAHVTVLQGEPTLSEVGELGTTVPTSITFSTASVVAYFPLLDDGLSDVGSYSLELVNSPTWDTGDQPSLSGGGGGGGDSSFLIVPRRQLFVTRRVFQH